MLQALARFAGVVRSLPLRLRFAVLSKWVGRDRAMSLTSERAASLPGVLGLSTRQAFYRRTLDRCGVGVHFGYQTLFSKHDARIGDRVYLGRFCTVGRVAIGDDTRVADGVQLLSGRHHHGSRALGVTAQETQHDAIRIGRGAWIGANAVVMADVGDRVIVAAGAVVTRPVPAGGVVGGVPAKPLSTATQPTHPRRAA
ncbi:MAG: acyltransferase [Phycisphaeraceae bacterium]